MVENAFFQYRLILGREDKLYFSRQTPIGVWMVENEGLLRSIALILNGVWMLEKEVCSRPVRIGLLTAVLSGITSALQKGTEVRNP
ncbi:hypothetical protein BCE02nite_61690 [Brevibacillus centrosporus]|nr:hypothetical protein BCE02nite_61690 [Brevibacillus centrosporus]